MRAVLVAVLAMLCLVGPVRAAEKCEYTESTFIEQSGPEMQIWAVSAKAKAAIIAKVNDVRASRGVDALDIDTVMFGLFDHQGQLMAAVMFFKDGCYIKNSGLIIPARDWALGLASLGLTDDDFHVLQGS